MNSNNLNTYREAVEFYAYSRVNEVLSNAGNDHAIIIFSNIFKTAEKKVLLLAKNLNNEVTKSSEYRGALRCFLEKKKTKLDVILTNYQLEDSTSPVFDLFREFGDKVAIKNSNGKGFKMKSSDQDVHFCIGDNRMYRLEYNTTDREARCNFNDPDFSGKLSGLFYGLFLNVDFITL